MSKLSKEGFVLNIYDPCVANKQINRKQCTIYWYIDDTKSSHVDPSGVSEVIKNLEDILGKMTVNRGKKHKFVGMDFELTDNNNLKI